MCHRFHHGSMKRSTIPPLWHFPNSTEPSEAYYCHPVLRHGHEESCPRTFLGQKSVRQKADFYLLPCWILGGLTLSAPSCGADLPQPPYTYTEDKCGPRSCFLWKIVSFSLWIFYCTHNVDHHFFLSSDALLNNLEEKFHLNFTHGCQKTNIDWNWLLCT